ncbi:uncharacterized protein LOC123313709 [Coccinella septempunctata]|uniref:uncharacterized protein LOC123313709 n=1 Tax=Coccinella septempunctata TaxID=41139 RepID=UPI001D064FD7|nr:uncharacterized protein LOC123313709 [Coccinella septempunctata]
MKVLIFVVCCIAALNYVACSSNDQIMHKLKYVETYLQEKQAIDEVGSRMEQICPGSKLKFEKAIEEVTTCGNEIDETAETSCSIIKNKMPKCLEPVMKVVKDCMPEGSKEIPDFILKSFLQGIEYICKTDGEHIFELGNTCLYKPNPTLDVCGRKLRMRFHRYEKNGVGVEDICSTLHYMRPCLKSHLNLSCGSPISREAILGFYDAFSSKCKTIADASSNELKETPEIKVSQLEDLS